MITARKILLIFLFLSLPFTAYASEEAFLLWITDNRDAIVVGFVTAILAPATIHFFKRPISRKIFDKIKETITARKIFFAFTLIPVVVGLYKIRDSLQDWVLLTFKILYQFGHAIFSGYTSVLTGFVIAAFIIRKLYFLYVNYEHFNRGMQAYKAEGYQEALAIWEPLAKRGYRKAQFYLGEMYEKGQGVSKNDAEAFKWYSKAAEEENIEGVYYIVAFYLSEGKGILKNPAEAFKWFRKAARTDDERAQNALGEIYMEGELIDQNFDKALKWFRKAATQGDAKAQNNLGNMYYKGISVAQNYIEAQAWYCKSAEQGNMDAQISLCEMYYEGIVVKKNDILAYMWGGFVLSTDKKNKDIGKIITQLKKRISEKDLEVAERLLRSAINYGFEYSTDYKKYM